MEQNKTKRQGSLNRRTAFLLFMAAMGIIAVLLYFEQVALIFVLATLALVILLIVVAFADLERVGRGDEPLDSATTPSDIKQSQSKE